MIEMPSSRDVDRLVIEVSDSIYHYVSRGTVPVVSLPGKVHNSFIHHLFKFVDTMRIDHPLDNVNSSARLRIVRTSISRMVEDGRLIPYKANISVILSRRTVDRKVTFYRPATVLERLAAVY